MAWRGRGILTQPTPQMAGWSVMLSPKPVQLRRVCDDATLCASRAAHFDLSHQQSRARVCITKVDLPSRRNTPSLTDEHRPDCVEKRRISYGVRARMKSEANKSTCTVERGAKGCMWPDLVKREVHCQEKKTVLLKALMWARPQRVLVGYGWPISVVSDLYRCESIHYAAARHRKALFVVILATKKQLTARERRVFSHSQSAHAF